VGGFVEKAARKVGFCARMVGEFGRGSEDFAMLHSTILENRIFKDGMC
jgi:hypothetical protein